MRSTTRRTSSTHVCIGTVVIDHRGLPLGGISLSALAFDLGRDRVDRLAPLVVGAGAAVSQAIGGLDVVGS